MHHNKRSVLSTLSYRKYVPEDIIFNNILPKLPAKSVLRFKCVCKSWLRYTETSNFIQLHLRQSLECRESILLHQADANELYYTDSSTIHKLETSRIRPIKLSPPRLSNEYDSHWFCVLASCNGLLLIALYNWCPTPTNKSLNIHYFLWNPSIPGALRKLVLANIDKIGYWRPLGFGYDETSDEYKLVFLLDKDSSHGNKVEYLVYRLRANSWKSVPAIPSAYLGNFYGVSLNNYLHEIDYDGKTKDIVRFDLRNEVWDDHMLDMYPDVKLDDGRKYIGAKLDVYKGMLSMVIKIYNNNCHGFCKEFWVMKEYGVEESWTRLFQIPSGVSIDRVLYSQERDKPLLTGYKSGSFAWYNSEQDVEEIEIEIPGMSNNEIIPHKFVLGSLVSVY